MPEAGPCGPILLGANRGSRSVWQEGLGGGEGPLAVAMLSHHPERRWLKLS